VRRRTLLGSAFAVAALPRRLAAQGAGKIPRIGFVTAQAAAGFAPFAEPFRAGLGEFGYAEERNLAIEFRYADNQINRVPELVAELVRLPIDLLVAQGPAVPVVAKLDLPVPVVYAYSGDPVTAGFAESLARPRGNMTGLTFIWAELTGKRLELLREMVPELRRVAILANPQHPGEHLERIASEEAARLLDATIAYFPTRSIEELTAALTAMSADPPQAISVFSDAFAVQHRKRMIDFQSSHKVPLIAGWSIFSQSGALCTYGPNLSESYRRLAYYVDRILKGAKPADLPIEQPTKFELVLNLKSANQLGMTIPQSVLARATEVIE
jgi:putative tryptophan/tyrosine transport system substrate-binding protein